MVRYVAYAGDDVSGCIELRHVRYNAVMSRFAIERFLMYYIVDFFGKLTARLSAAHADDNVASHQLKASGNWQLPTGSRCDVTPASSPM